MIGMEGSATANRPATLAEGPLLRPDQAAHLVSVKTSWVYEAMRSGRAPCIQVGRHIRFTRQMLEDWLAEQPQEQRLRRERSVDLGGQKLKEVQSICRYRCRGRSASATGIRNSSRPPGNGSTKPDLAW